MDSDYDTRQLSFELMSMGGKSILSCPRDTEVVHVCTCNPWEEEHRDGKQLCPFCRRPTQHGNTKP